MGMGPKYLGHVPVDFFFGGPPRRVSIFSLQTRVLSYSTLLTTTPACRAFQKSIIFNWARGGGYKSFILYSK